MSPKASQKFFPDDEAQPMPTAIFPKTPNARMTDATILSQMSSYGGINNRPSVNKSDILLLSNQADY